jgi:outer membrane cobalamin receptor
MIVTIAGCVVCLLVYRPTVASALTALDQDPQAQDPSTQPAPAADQPVFRVEVIETTPLPGLGLKPEQVPAPVQTAVGADIEASGALDLSDFLNRRFNGVFVNEVQNNPFQPDLNYRGYTASPLLGTPQGLSIYMDGVRMNQPFGDVVSWDLIPQMAIKSTTLMPGSSPLFGLNTLGGALAIETKDGRTSPGTTARAIFGSNTRRAVEFEHGGSRSSGLNWYVAGNLFADDGWRDESPSDLGQLFGKLGWHQTTSDTSFAVGYADNSLAGNGL